MKLEVGGRAFKSNGSVEAVIRMIDDAERLVYADVVNMTKKTARDKFCESLRKTFPRETKGKDLESLLLDLSMSIEPPEPEGDDTPETQKESQADKLMRLVSHRRIEFFHTPTDTAYARIPQGDHFEIHKCRSQSFKQVLSYLMWDEEHKTPNSDSLNSVVNTVEGKAIHDGECHELHNRVAWLYDDIWYDLSDDRYRAVKISQKGWEIVDQPPILFQRYQHQSPQVEPITHGDPKKILDYVNITNDEHKLLLMVYIAACFIPDIAHPILHPWGGQGAAKSTLMRLVVSLTDPSEEDLLVVPRNEKDLAQRLNHHWTCCFDNLATIPDWLSDTLSRAVTGAGFSKRELFTDDNVVIYKIKRVIGLNGVNIVAIKPDLLDRCILLELERIDETKRQEEKSLWRWFDRDKPAILGGFFDTIVKAIRYYPEVKLERLPRLADFGRWGEAISRALGYAPNEFMEAYFTNINSQNDEVLASNPIASCIIRMMTDPPVDEWFGTPAELLTALNAEATQLNISTKMKSWPKAPHILTRRVNELKTNLIAGGFDIETNGTNGRGAIKQRTIGIYKRATGNYFLDHE